MHIGAIAAVAMTRKERKSLRVLTKLRPLGRELLEQFEAALLALQD
jgi:hypothetical protein